MATPKNVKQAMDNGNYKVTAIQYKGSDKIRVDFKPVFARSEHKSCSFWINRDYFKRMYPSTYNSFNY